MNVNGRTIVADTSRTSAQWFNDVSPHNLANTAVNMREVIASAVRRVIHNDYPDSGFTYILTEFRIATNPDAYGNSFFATFIYGRNNQYASSLAGRLSDDIQSDSHMQRIVWETYMD